MARVNSKNTKAQILDAYKQLELEKAQLEKQLKAAKTQSQTNSKQVAEPQDKEITTKSLSSSQSIAEKILKISSNQYNIEQIIQNLEQLQLGFGTAVSQLSEQLITEASSLEKLQTEISEEREQLEQLHSLNNIAENTLENLIDTYEESQKNFSEEFSQQQETLGQELEDLRQTWRKQQDNKRRELQERNEDYTKTKKRQEEEYLYNLQLQRQLDEDEHEHHLSQLYQQLEEVRQNQQKQWQEREDNLAEKEKEYAEAKEKVAAFKAELEAKIKRGKEEGKGIGNYQARVKADLLSKEIEGETQNYQLRIQALETTIANNETRLAKLSQQLDASLKQVQDLAVKAIDGTSNRNSFDAMKEIALEQAKNQQKSK